MFSFPLRASIGRFFVCSSLDVSDPLAERLALILLHTTVFQVEE